MGLRRGELGRALRFVAGGAGNTAVTWLIYVVLLRNADYRLAFGITYAIGIVLSYAINSRYVFKVRPTLRGMLSYPAVYVVQFVLTEALLWLAVELVRIPQQLALLVATICALPVTFLLTRRLLAPRSPPQAMHAPTGPRDPVHGCGR